jgi:hypothetical protein
VAADLAEGYVTPAGAERDYGVIWRAGAMDAPATTARRAALLAARLRVRLTGAADLDADRGRLVRLDSQTAARLGVGPGAIVELVNPRGAPLRAWVAAVVPGNGQRGEISPDALGMLGLDEGALVELRAVHSGSLGPV